MEEEERGGEGEKGKMKGGCRFLAIKGERVNKGNDGEGKKKRFTGEEKGRENEGKEMGSGCEERGRQKRKVELLLNKKGEGKGAKGNK